MHEIDPPKDNIIKKVLDVSIHYKMLQAGDSVLISLSGGPDSIFLANFFLRIKNIFNLKLNCFHLDHKTRGKMSAQDAGFVEDFCSKKGLVLFKEEIDAKAWAHKNKMTFQEGARTLRVRLLNEIAEKHRIKKIATGHTADDNIETFFMHLLRGSGMKGLAGIKPVDGIFIRPLIETFRKDILSYLDENKIGFCVDSSNLENVYFRNKIRNLLLPFISENITPGNFQKRIANTAKILREENDLLDGLARDFFKSLTAEAKLKVKKQIEIPLKKIADYPDAFKKRIILAAIEEINGSTTDLKSINIDRVLKVCFLGGERKEIIISRNLSIIKESDRLIFTKSRGKKQATRKITSELRKEYKFAKAQAQSENILILRSMRLKFTSKIIAGGLKEIKNKKIPDSEAYLDYEKISFPVHVGFYITGSGLRFMPLGMQNLKKVHDFFIDEKIPKNKRMEIPVFYDKEKVIWLGGHRIDNRVRLDANTKKIFNIKIFNI